VIFLAPAVAPADTYNPGPLTFQTSGQSMWGPGSAFILERSLFLGKSWSASGGPIGGITGSVTQTTICPLPNPFGGCLVDEVPVTIDTRTGAIAGGSTSGTVGFNLGVKMDSGSVNATLNYQAAAVLPNPNPLGTFFNLNPSSALVGGQLATNFPEVSGRVDAVLGVQASINGQICAIGFGCTSGSTGTLGFTPKTLELLSFNDVDSPGQIKILGLGNPSLFQFGAPITVPNPGNPLGEVGNVTIHVPDINTLGGVTGARLTSTGEDDLLDLRVDIDGLILGAFGLPGLGIALNAGIFDVSGDLLDIELGPTIKIVQNFELTPTLRVELQFDHPVRVNGLANPVTSLIAPWNLLPDIALLHDQTLVTPRFFVDGLLSNETLLGIDGVFTIDALKASIALSAFGVSLDLGELGPVFAFEARGNLFNSPNLFDQQFGIGGFDPIAGAPFLLRALGVPQPVSVLLLVLGLAGAGVASRKRAASRPRASTSLAGQAT